jgi:hypothetical protein
MAKIWTTSRGTWQYIEWNGIMAFLGFGTLSAALSKFYPAWFVITLAIIGFVLVLLAARNSYKHKSTALVDEYERRFFERMKKERKLAAQYLLKMLDRKLEGDESGCVELDGILDFFQAPIADKINAGLIDEEQIYEYFHLWIFLYIHASLKYIENYRKEDFSSWAALEPLYNRMLSIKRKKEKKIGGNKDWVLSEGMLRRELNKEASLKID